MGLVIDGFSHILPKSFIRELSLFHPTDELRASGSLTHLSEIENRIRVLDKYRIDKQILTLARPSLWTHMAKDIALKMTRVANETLCEITQKYSDRFIPVGTLPIPSEEFMSEFDRCMEDLHMAGIQIFSNVGGRPLDDMEFRSFFAKAHRTRTPIWIHPHLRSEWSPEFVLDRIFGWLFDTSLALSRLVFSGMMEEYPDLTIISHHMGGMIPYFSERIRSFYEARDMFPQAKFCRLSKDPLEYFKRFYADSILNGSVSAFECGYRFFGPGRIIFATDYPFGPGQGEPWVEEAIHQIRISDLPQVEKDQILGGTLQGILEMRES